MVAMENGGAAVEGTVMKVTHQPQDGESGSSDERQIKTIPQVKHKIAGEVTSWGGGES